MWNMYVCQGRHVHVLICGIIIMYIRVGMYSYVCGICMSGRHVLICMSYTRMYVRVGRPYSIDDRRFLWS